MCPFCILSRTIGPRLDRYFTLYAYHFSPYLVQLLNESGVSNSSMQLDKGYYLFECLFFFPINKILSCM